MYRSETQRFIERALKEILSKGDEANSKLSPRDQEELAEMLTNRIWLAGYELEPRMRLGQTANAASASAN